MDQYRLLKKEECGIDSSFWNRYIEVVKKEVIPNL